MNLKKIISIKSETKDILEKYREEFLIEAFATKEGLCSYLEEHTEELHEMLLVAATDSTIMIGREFGIAILGYASPDFPQRTYRGVEMLVEGFEEIDADFLIKRYQRYHHIPWTILETERCIVKELSLEDMDALFALYQDEKIGEFVESLYPYEEEKEFQRAYINNMYRFFGYGLWLVYLKEDGTLIGRAGLEHREYNEEPGLELGYMIAGAYQNKGYATEVCKAILDYAREHTAFEEINCLIDKENRSSIALAEKLGFSHVADYEYEDRVLLRFTQQLITC